MTLVGRERIADITGREPSMEGLLIAWAHEIMAGQWQSLDEIREQYPNIEVGIPNAVVFPINGQFCVLAQLSFGCQVVNLRFAGKRSELDAQVRVQ